MQFAIVGAGFSGAVLAHELAAAGHAIEVYESRPHIAGNCHTERDPDTGVLVHRYGPHIFHTDSEEVWAYVQRFGEFVPYINRVKTRHRGRVYSMPLNLHTINQFFDKALSPREARDFVAGLGCTDIDEPRSFEEQALRFVGRELYEAFFKSYTEKQWGLAPAQLPASILKRLPLRFNYDDNYYSHRYQGMPREGYTALVARLLDAPGIRVHCGQRFTRAMGAGFDHVFYSGPLDAWFDHAHGRLAYRTLDFVREVHDGDYQGCAVMNYPDADVPYTRIAEHKHFAPWEPHERTVVFKEHSRLCGADDVPYYPIRLVDDVAQLRQYVERARRESGVSFVGRLGTYRYLDMDVTIGESLAASREVLACLDAGRAIPAFFTAVA